MRILLVEDNPGDARLFEELVVEAEIPDITIDWRGRLDEGCRSATESRYDAAFLDLGLPDAEGLPALQSLHRAAPRLPIIVLTGRSEEALSLAALQNGAQDYLLKDRLNAEHLGQTIRFAIQRKQVEESLKEREREIHHAKKLEAIGQLAAGIAHEINTPMQFIGDNLFFLKEAVADLQPLLEIVDRVADADGATEISREVAGQLARHAKDADLEYLIAELPAALERSSNGVERVTKIVRAMKEFSHPGTEERRLVQLASAIESTLTVCRSEWKYVAELAIDISPDLPPVSCYLGDLNQVILNLVVNAAHAITARLGEGATEKGEIEISAREVDGTIEIRVSDTGSGIPESARPRIFEPFFTTKDVGKGTGQGLSVAYNVVVEKHGGTIGFETEVGVGTTFIIGLPLEPVTVASDADASAQAPAGGP